MRTHLALGLAATVCLLLAGSVAEWRTAPSVASRRQVGTRLDKLDKKVEPLAGRPLTPSPVIERRRRRRLEKAAARLDRDLGIPVVLPASLPPGTRLDPKFGMSFSPQRREGEIVLRVPGAPHMGRIAQLWIQYGVATFDGCGGDNARETRVGNAPALYQRFFLDGRFKGVTVIWPARHGRAQGRYGLSGTFPTATMFMWAEEMEAARRVAIKKSTHRRGC